ncbi:MAG: BrnA antitoxin family protein [Pseudomonadota bacterium]
MNEEFQATWPDQAALQAVVNAAPLAANGLPMKQIVTIRLDIDMLNWFKSGGPGYQTRINQILRDHMQAQRGADSEAA